VASPPIPAPPKPAAAEMLGAGTGVRISEALAVTSDRIDWLRRTVTIDRQLSGVSGGSPGFAGERQDESAADDPPA
jgi:integrase